MKNLSKALVDARKEIANPHFDSENPHFRSKFASLKSVIEAVVPVANRHGITVIQDLTAEGCVTYLIHDSGEHLKLGPYPLNSVKSDPQAVASASTYARRYTLQAAFCVTGEQDDDGNAASESSFSSKQTKTKTWKALRDAAAEGDALKACETWDEMNTEQQQEIWRELSSGQRSAIKVLLEDTVDG